MPQHLIVGKQAEELALRFLKDRAYKVLGRNWRRKWGELDIIAQKDGNLCFIEVKGESATRSGFDAWRRANSHKLAKVARTAKTWMASNGYRSDSSWQIDVIQVSIRHDSSEAHIIHFKGVRI